MRVTSSFARMNVLLKDLEQQNQELSKKEKRWKEIEDRKTVNASKIGARIHLNIGILFIIIVFSIINNNKRRKEVHYFEGHIDEPTMLF